MQPARRLTNRYTTFGGRVPAPVGVLILLTVLASIVDYLGAHLGFYLSTWGDLAPAEVWSGQLWRLVSWIFFETQPVSLLFACLILYWFGRDLCDTWGTKRFLWVYLGLSAAAAALTCVVGRFWPSVAYQQYSGTWPIAEALTIAWALTFPDRQIRLYFVLPVGGRTLIYATIGLTALFAMRYGLSMFIPHFLAEALVLAYMNGLSPRRLWLKLRLAMLARKTPAARRAPHLHVMRGQPGDGGDDDSSPDKRWLN